MITISPATYQQTPNLTATQSSIKYTSTATLDTTCVTDYFKHAPFQDHPNHHKHSSVESARKKVTYSKIIPHSSPQHMCSQLKNSHSKTISMLNKMTTTTISLTIPPTIKSHIPRHSSYQKHITPHNEAVHRLQNKCQQS